MVTFLAEAPDGTRSPISPLQERVNFPACPGLAQRLHPDLSICFGLCRVSDALSFQTSTALPLFHFRQQVVKRRGNFKDMLVAQLAMLQDMTALLRSVSLGASFGFLHQFSR